MNLEKISHRLSCLKKRARKSKRVFSSEYSANDPESDDDGANGSDSSYSDITLEEAETSVISNFTSNSKVKSNYCIIDDSQGKIDVSSLNLINNKIREQGIKTLLDQLYTLVFYSTVKKKPHKYKRSDYSMLKFSYKDSINTRLLSYDNLNIVYKPYFFDNKSYSKSNRKKAISKYSKRNLVARKIGQGYVVDVNRPPLTKYSTLSDFVCNNIVKSKALGGEGASAQLNKSIIPLEASSANLELSMLFDELSIDSLKLENNCLRYSESVHHSTSAISNFVNTKQQIINHIREYNDDLVSEYHPLPIAPEKHLSKANVYSTKVTHIPFHYHIINLVEINSTLMNDKGTYISKILNEVLPIIHVAYKHNTANFHFVGTYTHFAYFFYVFALFSQLDEYFRQTELIPLISAFQAVGHHQLGEDLVYPEEVERFVENIQYGGSLSYMFCKVRDLSIAITLRKMSLVMIRHQYQNLEQFDKKTPDKMIKSALKDARGRPLYFFKFEFHSGLVSVKAHKMKSHIASKYRITETPMQFPNIPPFYPNPSQVSTID